MNLFCLSCLNTLERMNFVKFQD